MRHTAFRLLVALLTFFIGVGAAAVRQVFRPAPVLTLEAPRSSAFVPAPHAPHAPPPASGHIGCGDGLGRKMVVAGGVLTGKALTLPQPAYPAIAKAARASGTVVVHVLISETGDVISASAVSGHPLLQQAAVAAANRAKFAPTRLSGEPVRVWGVVSYNFVLE